MTRFAAVPLRDAILPAVLATLAVAEMAGLQVQGWQYGAALEVLACLMLVWRRRHPLVLPTLAGLTLLVIPWLGPALDDPSLPIPIWALAVFALARWNADLRGLIGVGLIAGAVFTDLLLVGKDDQGWPDVIFVTALIAPPYVLGRVTRKLADQAEQLERQQERVKEQAVRDERARIARELHDVIAHSVSAMVVQTAAAQDLVRTDPDRAGDVLEDVAATGRRALAETGRLLHVIRDDADELGLSPAPGLRQLPDLVDRFRESGLEINVELDGPLQPLPVGVDLSAYRIVQEALTNALKYAGDKKALVRVTSRPTVVSIHSENAGGGPGGVVNGSGLGLVGMAERVSVFGGSLTHGFNGDGRFVLNATLPVLDGVDRP